MSEERNLALPAGGVKSPRHKMSCERHRRQLRNRHNLGNKKLKNFCDGISDSGKDDVTELRQFNKFL